MSHSIRTLTLGPGDRRGGGSALGRSRARVALALAGLAAGSWAAALGVDLLPASSEVVFGAAPVDLRAVAQMDDAPAAWAWSVAERDGGVVMADAAGGSARYYPPFVLEPTEFHIRASAADGSGRTGEATVRVHPHGTFRKGGPVSVIDAYAGRNWHLPRLETLAGARHRVMSLDGFGAEAGFQGISSMVWMPRHPDPRLSGRWLVADHGSLRTVTPEGVVETYGDHGAREAGPGSDLLDERPLLPGPGGVPWAGCEHLALGPGRGAGDGPELYLSGNDGRIHVLDRTGAMVPYQPDPARPLPPFNAVGGMAVDGEGRLWLTDAERGAVKTVDRTGAVRRVAGVPGKKRARVDGGPGQGQLLEPRAITLDARTGCALVSDGRIVRWVHPDGSLSTLRERKEGAAAAEPRAEPCFSGGRPYWSSPAGLAVSGDALLVVNHGIGDGLALINLRTGARTALVQQGGGILTDRDGLILPVPGVPKSDMAALHQVSGIALGPAGEVLVEADGVLRRLVLPADPEEAAPKPDTKRDDGR